MSDESEEVKCSKCQRVLLAVTARTETAWTPTHPEWGTIMKLPSPIGPAPYILELFCQDCGHLQQWSSSRWLGNVMPIPGNVVHCYPRKSDAKPPFALLASAISGIRKLGTRLADSSVQKCTEAFVENLTHVESVGEFAVLAAGLGNERRMLEDTQKRATQELPTNISSRGYYINAARLVKLFRPDMPDDLLESIHSSGCTEINHWKRIHPQIGLGISTILKTQVTLAWTAFETLSSDLWERLVNLRPALALIALKAEAITPADSYAEKEEKLRKGLKVPIAGVLQPGFDIKKSMGTVLKWDRNNWSFQGWLDAKAHYLDVFPDKRDQMCQVFDDKTRLLAETRNLVVHKAGIVDEKFHDAAQAHAELSQYKVGSALLISGSLAGELINAAVESGNRLIEFADEYLRTSPA